MESSRLGLAPQVGLRCPQRAFAPFAPIQLPSNNRIPTILNDIIPLRAAIRAGVAAELPRLRQTVKWAARPA